MTIPTSDLRWMLLQHSLQEAEDSSDPLIALSLIDQSISQLHGLAHEAGSRAREQGCTWDDIGKALGITKQGAWLRMAGAGAGSQDSR